MRTGNLSRRGLKSRWEYLCQHFTPLTFDIKTGVVSDEDTTEIWETVKELAKEKVRRNKNRASGGNSTLMDEEEVERSASADQISGW